MLKIIRLFTFLYHNCTLTDSGLELKLQGNQILIDEQGIKVKSDGIIRLNGIYTLIQCADTFSPSEEINHVETSQL